MKTIALITIVVTLFACDTKEGDNQPMHNTTIDVIVDITDKKTIWPHAQDIIPLFQCAKHPEASCIFNMHIVSDKKTNPSFTNILSDMQSSRSENTYDDALFRQKQILGFQEAIRQSFTTLYKEVDTTTSLNYSEVWATVVNTINQLLRDTNQRKILLIYSDLMEKNDAINAYKLIQNESVSSIAKKLEQQINISEKLTGITVVTVYEPKNRTEDFCFNKMLQVYKTILEEHGAQVFQQANPIFNL